MMRRKTAVLRREAEGQRHIEGIQRSHLPVEPLLGIRPEAVGPTEPGAQVSHPEALHPVHRQLKAMIIEMEPLADPEFGGEFGKALSGALWRAILAQQPH